MFSYDDPIHAEDIEFTGLTIVYIVNVEGRYAIKAISTGLHEISKDPTTNAEFYCLLNAESVLKKDSLHSVIFPDNKLTKGLFSAKDILDYFDLDISKAQFQAFKIKRIAQSRTPAPAGIISHSFPSFFVVPRLNSMQQEALSCLCQYGLTVEMLLNRNDGGYEFKLDHWLALRYLVITKKYGVLQALAEIEGLSDSQASGIPRGLLRSDVISLSNVWHVAALAALKVKGLTAEMLLNRNEGGFNFEGEHYNLLRQLVLRENETIDAALVIIDGLSVYHVQALSILKAKGLTKEMLLECKTNGGFGYYHQLALCKLVSAKGFSVAQALAEIAHLNDYQASRIYAGEARDIVIRRVIFVTTFYSRPVELNPMAPEFNGEHLVRAANNK